MGLEGGVGVVVYIPFILKGLPRFDFDFCKCVVRLILRFF